MTPVCLSPSHSSSKLPGNNTLNNGNAKSLKAFLVHQYLLSYHFSFQIEGDQWTMSPASLLVRILMLKEPRFCNLYAAAMLVSPTLVKTSTTFQELL